jgi:hypothetical protein
MTLTLALKRCPWGHIERWEGDDDLYCHICGCRLEPTPDPCGHGRACSGTYCSLTGIRRVP